MPRRKTSERGTRARTLLPCRLVFLAACAWAGAASNAGQGQSTIEQCADIAEDAERLACFDRAVRPAAPVRAIEEPKAAPAEDADPAAEPARSERRAASRAAIHGQAQVRAKERPAPPAEADRRGLFRRLFRDRGRPEASGETPASAPRDAAEPAGVAAKVERVAKLMRGNFQLVLDNGQTWRENEYQPGTTYEVGDAVLIRERFLGMHDLTNRRTRQVVRVSRVR